MKQAAKEAFKKNIHHYDTVKIIAKDYLSNQECPVEAAMYHILPELKLRRIFFLVYFFVNSSNVFNKSNIDRYM